MIFIKPVNGSQESLKSQWLHLLGTLELDRLFRTNATVTLTPGRSICVAMTELGTTFIKLGQVLSTRPALVGKKLADQLAQLRADTPADKPALAIGLIESEVGGKIVFLFADFEANTFASASIGQVNRATTHDGNPALGAEMR